MHLAFDICQGIGIAAAVGIRPFLPSLAVGALAAGDVEIQFKGTDYSFLQSPGFLLGAAIAAILLALLERRLGSDKLSRGVPLYVLAAISIVLGAMFFAGALAQHHHAAWPGWIGGAICAVIGLLATGPLFSRVRSRLDAGAAGFVVLYAEAAAVILAVLSVIAPPVGPIGLLLLLWLLFAERRRQGQKYAGLRILR